MTLISAATTLFLILDPMGNVPIFLSVLDKVEPERRRKVLIRELLIAFVILNLFLFFGRYILSAMHISEPALSFSGGILLFLIAIRMIFPRSDKREGRSQDDEPFIVPLAVPLIAGPSAMAMVILFTTREPERMLTWFLALLLAWFASSTVLFFGEFLRRVMKPRLMVALERLMGMILTTMAIQMLLTGVENFLAALS